MTDLTDKANFERRLQSIAQALMLAILIGIGTALVSLVKSSAQQEIINGQTARDIGELKTGLGAMQTQAMNAATAATTAATAATAAAAVAATAVSTAAALNEGKKQR